MSVHAWQIPHGLIALAALSVVQNFRNMIAVLKLSPDYLSGTTPDFVVRVTK